MEKKNKTIKVMAKVKPAFVVDFTDIDTLNIQDISVRFVESKLSKGMSISPREVMIIVTDTMRKDADTFDEILSSTSSINDFVETVKELINSCGSTNCNCSNKKPWYKRFWNWITKPFKKNK